MQTRWQSWLMGVLILVVLAGCGRGPYSPSDPVGEQPEKTVDVVEYRGHDLFCVQQSVAHGSLAYTCDFAAFYAEPPQHGSKRAVAHVSLVTMPYRGRTLYCFAFDAGHGTSSYTCDFQRFYQENADATFPPLG